MEKQKEISISSISETASSSSSSQNDIDDVDPWNESAKRQSWSEMDCKQKCLRILIVIFKIVCVLGALYFFICALDLMASSFQLLAGKSTSDIFSNPLLQNPLFGLMAGVVATAILQSSSSTTSIIITLVAAGALTVQGAIPFIMGSNIGTSITSTFVAFQDAGKSKAFGRSFAGATVHDMFNWLAVVVLLPIELLTGYLYYLTTWMVGAIPNEQLEVDNFQGIKVITKPFTEIIVQLNKTVLDEWARANPKYENATLLKTNCGDYSVSYMDFNGSTTSNPIIEPVSDYSCSYLMYGLSDSTAGWILLASSLVTLIISLTVLGKVLRSEIRGKAKVAIRKVIDADFKHVSWLKGYLALLIGAFMTMLLQSSSVFTSILVPLVGDQIISLQRMYPLTLGSNLGTTVTGLLAALSVDATQFRAALQVALCHVFFNVTGILLFYPIPFLRLPIPMAKLLGKTTAKYGWFAPLYIVVMFILLPAFILALSTAGTIILYSVGGPILFILIVIITINILQLKKPVLLPKKLQTWEFLPLWMHSLDPVDRVLGKCKLGIQRNCCCCCSCCKQKTDSETSAGDIQKSKSGSADTIVSIESEDSSENPSENSSVCSSEETKCDDQKSHSNVFLF